MSDNANVQIPQEAVCWRCKKPVDAADNYCRHCGSGLGGNVKWYYQHWGIIFLLFFALGPLVLPYVWRSPRLSRNAKLVYTAIALLYTYLIYTAVAGVLKTLSSYYDASAFQG